MMLDLTPGITETLQYKAWKFPGGEIHFQLKEEMMDALESHWDGIKIRLTSAESIIFLAIVVDTIYKDFNIMPKVNIGYMPYQQADRDFGAGECFSLHTICNILNSLPVYQYKVFDPHSDVTPALLNNVEVEDNSEFVEYVIDHISSIKNRDKEEDEQLWTPQNNLTILSPDAGAYKKIFKLCEKIKFTGAIETANKYRDTSNGELQVRLSAENFKGRDILIVDDICMGGRTFTELAKQIRANCKNVSKIYLAISHGVFSNGFQQLSATFNKIYTTDSYKSEYPYHETFLNVYNLK